VPRLFEFVGYVYRQMMESLERSPDARQMMESLERSPDAIDFYGPAEFDVQTSRRLPSGRVEFYEPFFGSLDDTHKICNQQ